ncbi:unnamed protein product [Soboliphyme baturini]|uniref:Secreted protein n=1 Tax=Soboliphyme baturini TaxID=241478 RepID=A0A183IBL7_9BILA|nr:unnamed protein product [Soboliphyme baturini]
MRSPARDSAAAATVRHLTSADAFAVLLPPPRHTLRLRRICLNLTCYPLRLLHCHRPTAAWCKAHDDPCKVFAVVRGQRTGPFVANNFFVTFICRCLLSKSGPY